MCPAAVSAARPHLYRSSFQQRLPRFVSPLEKNTAKKTERKKRKKNKRAKKDRKEGRSVRQLLLATVSGSQRAFSSFAFVPFKFSLFLSYPHL
jgi:hypothetical protein